MPRFFDADTSELDQLTQLFDQRANSMVDEAHQEATQWANARATAGRGKQLPTKISRHHATARRFRRQRQATPIQIAHMFEEVMYHKLLDFFGSW